MKITSLALGLAMLCVAGPALAANVDVQLLNTGENGEMVFQPDLIRIAPGDTVTFVPVDKGHNAESIPTMMPAGAEGFKGKISQPITQTFTVPGVYGIKCTPHFAMGMVALVVVGDDLSNLDAVEAVKVPKTPADRFHEIFEELQK
jgi:pseudoazurin